MKTNRRWLKSAIAAASQEEIMLPWAAKRIQQVEKSMPASAQIIRIFPSAPAKYAAIAAR
jgi:hypothetical protein